MFIRITRFLCTVALTILATVLSGNAYAQKSAFWGNLEPGSYPVSFKVIYKYDYSRSWKPKRGVEGQLTLGERARPVRISVWYPAQKQTAALKALYRDYVYFKTSNKDFTQTNKMLEERDAANLRHIFKNSEQVFQKLLSTQMAASLNALPSRGSFPLVVYSSGLNDISSSNVVLWEYLASHGYVVITVPQLGTTSDSVNLGINPIDLETQIRDLEFALAAMHDFPNVDRNKLAAMGHSMGGVAIWNLSDIPTDIFWAVPKSFTAISPAFR
jgi:hypothetical protein